MYLTDISVNVSIRIHQMRAGKKPSRILITPDYYGIIPYFPAFSDRYFSSHIKCFSQ